MAKLPSFKDFRKEDYQEAPAYFGRFLYLLNSFSNSIYKALDKKLTFGENIQAIVKELSFTTKSDYTSANFDTIQIANTMGVKASGILVLYVCNSDRTQTVNVIGNNVEWTEENNILSIHYITGLENSKSYIVRVLII